jgi:outer membrane protein
MARFMVPPVIIRHLAKCALGAVLVLSATLLPLQALAAPAAAVPQLTKIAVVDFERCIQETKTGSSAGKKIVKWLKDTEKRLGDKEKELKRLYEDLKAKASMLAPAEIEKRQQELMRRDQELQGLVAETQESQSVKEGELVQSMLKSVTEIVDELAQAEGVQLVLLRSQGTVLYVDPKLDLTNRVILDHDKKFSGEKAAKPAKK